MMNDLHFDDFVKKQLSDQTSEVPGHVIENVIAARKESDPKGFGMWFNSKKLLLTSVILILTVGGYLFISQITSSPTKNIKNNPSAIINKTNNPAENKKEAKETIAKTTNQIKINDQQIVAPGLNNSNNNDNKTINTTKVLASSSSSANTKIKLNKILTDEPAAGKEEKNINSYQDENNNSGTVISANTNNSIYYNPILFPFTFADTKELLNTKKLTSKLDFPSCPTIEKNAAGNKKYYEVYAGPDHAIGNYKTAISDSTTNNYLQKRKEASKISSAYSAGVRYTKVFNNAMSVRTGVNYSQINEKFKYINTNELKQVTVITTRIIIRSPGDTLFVKDTLQYLQSGTRIKTTYNHYRNIDIPLVLGYEVGNGRLHANINAGIIINVYSWYKGDVLDTSYQPVSITTGKNSPYQFKNNIGVGFLGGVSVYYKLTDDLHLLLEPYFRYNLSPISKENLNLQQKYHTVGLRAGLRFDIK